MSFDDVSIESSIYIEYYDIDVVVNQVMEITNQRGSTTHDMHCVHVMCMYARYAARLNIAESIVSVEEIVE